MKMATIDGRIDLRRARAAARRPASTSAPLKTPLAGDHRPRHLRRVLPDPVHPPGHRRQRRRRQGAAAAGPHPGRSPDPHRRRAVQVDGARAARHLRRRRQRRRALHRPRGLLPGDAHRSARSRGPRPAARAARRARRGPADEQLIDTFGLTRDGDTPFLLWQLRTEDRLLDIAVDTNRSTRTAARPPSRLDAAKTRAGRAQAAVEETRKQQRANGGDILERLDAEITRLTRKRATGDRAAAICFDDRVAPLLLTSPATTTFAGAAGRRGVPRPASSRQHGTSTSAARRPSTPGGTRCTAAASELAESRVAAGPQRPRVPKRLHEARLAIAAAAGHRPRPTCRSSPNSSTSPPTRALARQPPRSPCSASPA